MNTPLQDALIQSGTSRGSAEVGEYRAATTATRFTDPQAELTALRAGCGVYDLGFRTKISLTGGDRVRWLNGMVTNNIRDLALERGAYAFLLNPQGRILGDLYAYNRGESIVVDTDRSQVEKILATFDHYIIMDDVEVENLSDKLTALGVSGPKSRAILHAAGIESPELLPLQLFSLKCECECGCLDCTIVRGENPESYEIWIAPEFVKQLWDALIAAGATAVGSEALELQRILSGIPLYGVDIRERDLPQETEQERALNFTKGCYIGQEIVERIRSRGNVHRKFAGFVSQTTGQTTAKIAPGAKVLAGEKEVGEITSVASVLDCGPQSIVALGYIRREVGVPGREVMIGGAKATVVQLPVAESPLSEHESALAQPQAADGR
jgi:folate-binding protein YgfZ